MLRLHLLYPSTFLNSLYHLAPAKCSCWRLRRAGVALASNIGGMTSPISSPQNIFAIERMSMDSHPPSWLSWFAIALPVSFLSVLVCWAALLLVYRPGLTTLEVRPLKPYTDPMNITQVGCEIARNAARMNMSQG